MPQIEGVVEDVVFRNESNGFTVLSLKSGREHISAVGVVSAISTGEHVRVTGDWTEHPDYGRQIKISACESIRPTTADGIEKYLGSGIIRGVGPATAKLIVHHFGKRTLDVMDNEPDRLTEIAGIGPRRAQMIAESYAEQREMRQTMIFLQTYGLSPAMSLKIYKTFGDNAQAVLRTNPYLLVDKVQGLGFKTADGIAYALGIERESEHRIMCGIKYVMSEAVMSEGHTYLPYTLLIAQAAKVLTVDEDLIENTLTAMVLARELVQAEIEGDIVIYLPELYKAESEVARRMVELMRSIDLPDDGEAEKEIAKYERKHNVKLCGEQREAVRAAAYGGVTIITGGPGTGKTTSINCIIHLLSKAGQVVLCAPTGRAAKRMSETTGCEAKTIHRLLEYGGEEDDFQRSEDNPLDADIVIVDEMSMVDIFLMRALLRALHPGTRLILVGDADQLPSVGAGNVLRDLIESGVVPVVKLVEIFRQAEESMIVVNAHRINHGEMPVLNARKSDFFFERKEGAPEVQASVVALVGRRLPEYQGFDSLRDIQVMAPMKKGDVGVWQMNRLLQEALNPKVHGRAELTRGDSSFRLGDKVMQTRNNYQLEWSRNADEGMGVYNGDIGYITGMNLEERTLEVTFDDERVAQYGEAELEDLELAYCMSVHKSQGSEFEAVVMPLLNGPPMLYTRNLFYTAVTRAKRLVVLVGREGCIRQMVANNHIARRYSALAYRLYEIAKLDERQP